MPESAPVSVYYQGGPGEEDLRTPPGHTCSFPAGLPKPPRKKPPTKAYTGNVYTHHSFKMERNSFLPNLQKQTQIKQNEETEEYVLNEEQDKTPGKNPNQIEISNLYNREFKIMVINMLTELGRRMDKLSRNFNK